MSFFLYHKNAWVNLLALKEEISRKLAQLTQTKIYTCNGNNLERKCGFRITGSPYACEAACAEINRRIVS